MASGILVVCDHDGSTFKKTAAELLGKAAELVGQVGGSVTAFVAGDIDASQLGAFGATTVYQAAGAEFGRPSDHGGGSRQPWRARKPRRARPSRQPVGGTRAFAG